MNSNVILPNLWRFMGLVAVQVLILKQLSLGAYFSVLLYPLFIFFLPLQLATPYLVLLGFAVGLTVDVFYSSLGVHASAGAFSALARVLVFATFGPRGGFSGKEPVFSPVYFGWQSALSAAAFFMLLHLFWYFSVDEFTFVYLTKITLKTLASWFLTMIFVVFYMTLLRTRQ